MPAPVITDDISIAKTPENMVAVVLLVMGVRHEELVRIGRASRKSLDAKMILAWLLTFEFPDLRREDVGKLIGKSHDMVVYYLKKVRDFQQTKDASFLPVFEFVTKRPLIAQWLG